MSESLPDGSPGRSVASAAGRDTGSTQGLRELIRHRHPPVVVFEPGTTDTQLHGLARIGEPKDPDLALVNDVEEALLGLTADRANAEPTVTVLVGHLDVRRPVMRIVDRDLIHMGGQPQSQTPPPAAPRPQTGQSPNIR